MLAELEDLYAHGQTLTRQMLDRSERRNCAGSDLGVVEQRPPGSFGSRPTETQTLASAREEVRRANEQHTALRITHAFPVCLRPADQPIQARKSIRVVRFQAEGAADRPLAGAAESRAPATGHGKP